MTQDLLERLLVRDPPPFALLHRPESTGTGLVEILTGSMSAVDTLAEIPVPAAAGIPANPGPAQPEVLAVIPYRQLSERGFSCVDDGSPLLAMTVAEHDLVTVAEALQRIPGEPTGGVDGHFVPDDAGYAATVRSVVTDEIGQGVGANFVIKRSFVADLTGYSPRSALGFYRRLLERESGAYWTLLVHTGDRTFVGATPERHVSLRDGTAVMNPISGTYRYSPCEPTLPQLLDFLADRHRQPGGERLPGDQPVRAGRARLLQRGGGVDRSRRPRRADAGLVDPHPHRGHRPRRPAAHRRGRDAGPALRPGRGGRRDPGEGRRAARRAGRDCPAARACLLGTGPGRAPEGPPGAGPAQRADQRFLARTGGRPGRRRPPAGRPAGAGGGRRGHVHFDDRPPAALARAVRHGAAVRPAVRGRRPRPGGDGPGPGRPPRPAGRPDRPPAGDHRGPARRGPPVPRRLPEPPGAQHPAGTRGGARHGAEPGAAEGGRPVRPAGAGRVLQHVHRPVRRRPCRVPRCPRNRRGQPGPADRGGARAARAGLPVGAVPRRVGAVRGRGAHHPGPARRARRGRPERCTGRDGGRRHRPGRPLTVATSVTRAEPGRHSIVRVVPVPR